ncbi:winged helix-turn-helix domain-containing protein [Bacillus toyonensis]|uniref:winged helix-turn-helix domain-containing protein n=1 Tax=Bacillus toyonensis TaxID=155322 RepID=UPI000CD8AC3F|nr:winged helix-turn-helix domain-containing protein [Bacillus toyonensis]MED3539352.1 winged helix-turn-helix domain-containing protein [Bacillus toyonensis]MEE2021816.1 winged helix-turn-helix domain-containing protein [Bacillus toyonensis]
MQNSTYYLNQLVAEDVQPIIVVNSKNKASIKNLLESFNLKGFSNNIDLFDKEENYYRSKFHLKPNLIFDIANHCLCRNNENIVLSAFEFKLLYLLVTCEEPIPVNRLIDDLNTTSPGVLYVYIKKIREKIEENPNDPRILINIRGRGYFIQKDRIVS